MDRLAGSRRLAPIIIAGTLGYCLPTALLTVIHSPTLAFVLEVLRGGSTLVVDVLAVTALQRAVPSEQLARVFGVFFAFILGAISLGTLLTPIVINATSLHGGLLEQLGIFAAASRPVLERLLGDATQVEFGPGEAIVREGDAADALLCSSPARSRSRRAAKRAAPSASYGR